ncbi:MAG: hypothetical protein V1895_02390 [Parcubacteria group bacterium]
MKTTLCILAVCALALCLALGLSACSNPTTHTPAPKADKQAESDRAIQILKQYATPAPQPVAPEVKTDTTFTTQVAIDKWHADVKVALDRFRAVPDPKSELELLKVVNLTPESLVTTRVWGFTAWDRAQDIHADLKTIEDYNNDFRGVHRREQNEFISLYQYVELAALHRGQAQKLLTEWLSKETTNLLVDYCSGECSNQPRWGAIDLYYLTEDNAELRQLYLKKFRESFAKGRDWGRVDVYSPGSRPLWDENAADPALIELASLVVKTHDKELSDVLRVALNSLETSFETKTAELILSPKPKTVDMTAFADEPLARYIYDWVASDVRPAQLPDLEAKGEVYNTDWFIQVIGNGTVTTPELKRLWIKYELPVPTAGRKYSADEYDPAAEVARALLLSGNLKAGQVILTDLALSGLRVSLKGTEITSVNVEPSLARVLVDQGDNSYAMPVLARTMFNWYQATFIEQETAATELFALLDKPINAAVTNWSWEETKLYPHNAAQAEELLKEPLAALRQSSPDLYVKYVAEHGKALREFQATEQEILAIEGQIETLDKLLNWVPDSRIGG